jgi:DNA-binding SARP family transcriptional activator
VAAGLRFAVLGTIRAWRGGAELDLGSPQQRALLALLLLRPGGLVAVDDIVAAVWGITVPRTARGTIRTYVHRLRRVLGATDQDQVIRSTSGGYQLLVDDESVDLGRFRLVAGLAEAARARGDLTKAVSWQREALALWEDAPLNGVHGDYLDAQRDLLQQQRVAACEQLWTWELDLGEPAGVLDGVARLLDVEPMRERLHELRIRALYQSGRRADALAAYQSVRRLLADELGVDPGPRLRELQKCILQADGGLLASVPEQRVAAAPTPAQLPADLPAYVGRGKARETMLALLPGGSAHRPDHVAVTLIKGMAAVGKTTFAVHCAHEVADHFPDGQLYVNLRGFDAEVAPLESAEVIRGFLDALGAPPQTIPADLDACAALYRSMLAERRCLILLDNARDTTQVLPLLPGKPGSLVLVTSRHSLPGLVAATGANTVTLDLMEPSEAAEFLVKRLGADRVAAEPGAAADIIARCDRLPLALAVTAARALSEPTFPLAAIAAELSEAKESLDAFADTDGAPDLRAVLSWSYRALSAGAARLFRLLSVHQGTDISVPTAASLAALPVRATRALLRELAYAHLVSEHFPGRYTRHDLLRAYSTELFLESESPEQQRATSHRMFDHYLGTAHAADQLLSTHRDLMSLPSLVEGVTPEPLTDYQGATQWFANEYAVLVDLVGRAVAVGLPAYTLQLTWAIRHYQDRHRHWHDLATLQLAAFAVSEELGDPVGLAYSHRGVARVHCQRGWLDGTEQDFDQAEYHVEQALSLFGQLGDDVAMGYTLRQATKVAELKGQYDKALAHAERALRLFRSAGWRRGEGAALEVIGVCQVNLDRPQSSLAYYREACLIYEEYGEQFCLAHTLQKLGVAYHALGRYDDATGNYQRSIAIFRELDNVFDAADSLFQLSETHQAAGREEEAQVARKESLEIEENAGTLSVLHDVS